MKNQKACSEKRKRSRGFIIPLIIAIVAVLAVGGGVYLKNTANNFPCWPPFCFPGRLAPVSTSTNPIVGGDSDIHGCKASAGYSWCEVKNKCLRVWEEKCKTTLTQPSITVLSPNGGENYSANVKTFQINYLANNIGSSTLSIDLVSDSGKIINLSKSIKNTGVYLGYLGNISNLTSGKYKITITCWDKTYFSKDSSDDYFTITIPAKTSCTPKWTCGWGACMCAPGISPCTNGYQGMTVVDSNNCGVSSAGVQIACPALARECSN